MDNKLTQLLKFLEDHNIEIEDVFESGNNIELELGFENIKNKIAAKEVLYALLKKFNRDNYTAPVFLISNIKFDSDKFGGVGSATLRFADADFSKNTFQNYEIVELKPAKSGRLYAIIKRKNDYVIGAGYDTKTGTWAQGYYDYPTLEAAKEDLVRIAGLSGNKFTDTKDTKIAQIKTGTVLYTQNGNEFDVTFKSNWNSSYDWHRIMGKEELSEIIDDPVKTNIDDAYSVWSDGFRELTPSECKEIAQKIDDNIGPVALLDLYPDIRSSTLFAFFTYYNKGFFNKSEYENDAEDK